MILARADRELRALVAELRDDVAVAKHLGLELDELIEAAEGRTERLFWTVSDPHQYPGYISGCTRQRDCSRLE